ncbi:Gag-Pol polyprotein [Merluccius polli]|uniref:Gag-Pol polyprotein n=1 Tax=Merluccius polli TaxID=89951 RepID=A0AA47M3T1_MERPO|nr:Gag-Pol polyprotein [Merluccius polli]
MFQEIKAWCEQCERCCLRKTPTAGLRAPLRNCMQTKGAIFESAVVKELCMCTGITKTHTTPYHPQGNGTTEKFNRTLMDMLGNIRASLETPLA